MITPSKRRKPFPTPRKWQSELIPLRYKGLPPGNTWMTITSFRILLVAFLFSGCAHLVKISYPPEAVIHPRFDQLFTTWAGRRVQVLLTSSLREEELKYLLSYDQVVLADSIRQNGLRHEYRLAGRGTPLVIYNLGFFFIRPASPF